MLINQANLATLYTGFQTVFNDAFQNTQSDFDRVAMTVASSSRTEHYGWLGSTTRFREWLGDRLIQNLEAHDFSIKNKDFENTVAVRRNDIEDDTYGVYAPIVAQLGQDARTHPDELVFGMLGDGFAGLCYDGQPFFSAAHPLTGPEGETSSVSNFGGGTGTPWFLLDTTRMVKPVIFQKRRDYRFIALDREDDEHVFRKAEFVYGVDARVNAGYGLWQLAYASKQDLTAVNYAAARAGMLGLTGDNGRPLGIRPNLLVVPPSLEQAAREVLMAERTTGGKTNIWRNSAELLVTPWLV